MAVSASTKKPRRGTIRIALSGLQAHQGLTQRGAADAELRGEVHFVYPARWQGPVKNPGPQNSCELTADAFPVSKMLHTVYSRPFHAPGLARFHQRSQLEDRTQFTLVPSGSRNQDDPALDFYRGLGGTAAPVTCFTFDARR